MDTKDPGYVYLASPIDQAGAYPVPMGSVTRQRREVHNLLVDKEGITTFDPANAWTAPGSAGIVPVNETALINSSGVIAWLPKGVPSIGVAMEVQSALSMGIPIRVITDVRSFALPAEIVTRSPHQAVRDVADAMFDPEHAVAALSPRRTLPVRLMSEAARMPRRGYEDDAGLDLVVTETIVLNPGVFTDVPCDVAVQLPSDTWGMIVGRSSTLRAKGLLVNHGIIDPGWRGGMFAGAWNLTSQPVVVQAGERIAQLILMTNRTFDFELVQAEELEPSARGTNGFGSTGI